MTPDEFTKRLHSLAEEDGISYGRVHLIFDAESKHAQQTLKYRGYLALSDAFKSFFLQTVEGVNLNLGKVQAPLSPFYPMLLERLAHNFRSLCAGERIALLGYP